DDAQVTRARRDELLDDAARAPPAPALHPADVVVEGTAIAAELDISAPAAKARLRDDREPQSLDRCRVVQPPRPWMRNACRAEQTRSDQLVVRGEQRRGAVENAHALGRELVHDPQPVFDAV